MNNLKSKLIERGWSEAEADKIAQDVCDILPEIAKTEDGFFIRNFGRLHAVIKDKPDHLMKEGVHRKTFKIKFTQSRSVQKAFVKEQSSDIRKTVRNLLDLK